LIETCLERKTWDVAKKRCEAFGYIDHCLDRIPPNWLMHLVDLCVNCKSLKLEQTTNICNSTQKENGNLRWGKHPSSINPQIQQNWIRGFS
jgi:hypothetical protein